ncbi:hypothetical protein TNCV_3158491 [Trichonephila clavipes]|nr:hypothetical protein TNCV_3158491 [Trichonephila clavipes]
MNGGHGHRNGTTLCLLMNTASACNITMMGFEFGETMEPVILLCIQRLLTVIFQQHDPTWHAMCKSSSLPIRINSFLGHFDLQIYCRSKACDHND